MKIKRRTLLLSGMSTAALSVLTVPTFAKTFALEEFLTLSARITQHPVSQLNVTAASALLKAFEERGLVPDLADLAAGRTTNDRLAAQLVSAWYTGVFQAANGPVAVIFEDALLWKTAAFLHPWSTCGGATNYWALPPSA